MNSRHAGAFSPDTVALMRSPVHALGQDPDNALRLALRLAGSLGMLLEQVHRCMGLRGSELAALMALWDAGRDSMTELGKRISLSRAAITTLADRLEAAGYMRRLPDPTDRRRVLVEVTPRFEHDLFQTLAEYGTALGAEAQRLGADWSAFATAAEHLHRLSRSHANELRTVAGKSGKAITPRPTDELREHW